MPPASDVAHAVSLQSPRMLNNERRFWHRHVEAVLCDGRAYAEHSWKALFVRLHQWVSANGAFLVEDEGDRGSLPLREEVLAWAYCTLLAMPDARRQDYLRLRERTDDRRGLAEGAAAFRAGHYRLIGLASALQNQLEWLARLVRTLDADLAAAAYGWQSVIEGNSAALRLPGYGCSLVPVTRAHRQADGLPVERRGLLLHAFVPARIGATRVDIEFHPDLTGEPESQTWRYGAAVFPDNRVDVLALGDDEFRVVGSEAPARDALIKGQVADAVAAGCDVVMWPELTMPDDARATLARELAAASVDGAESLRLVVAGSWHVGEGAFRNRTWLFDRRGDLLFEYDKRQKFRFKGRTEGIVPGDCVKLLVTEDRLVAVGICLDFCGEIGRIYNSLDCDLVLVPSMGTRTSTDAHVHAAKSVQTRHDTVTFVVQQVPVLTGDPPERSEPQGYSMAVPVSDPKKPPRYEQNDPFRVLTARR